MNDTCLTCGNSKQWHLDNRPRHIFRQGDSPPDIPKKKNEERKEDQITIKPPPEIMMNRSWPLDPVLRQALIDKNVLTPEDLRKAEEKIRAVTAQFLDLDEGGRNKKQDRQENRGREGEK